MLNQYKNINEIVNSKTSLSGVRISNKQSEFFFTIFEISTKLRYI